MHEVIMPKLGLTMESGMIEKWHKKEGEKVEQGDVLFEVMTDKVSLEVEAYNSGILRKILRGEGEEVPVTEVVAYIGDKDEKIPSEPGESVSKEKQVIEQKEEKEEAAAAEEKELVVEKNKEAHVPEEGRINISPLARKIAKDKNINVSKISGTGPGGRIVKEDLEKYIAGLEEEKVEKRIKISPLARKTAKDLGIDYKSEPIKGTGPGGRITKEDILAYEKVAEKEVKEEIQPQKRGEIAVKSSTTLKGMRKVIAERMSYSKTNIPHIVLNAVADTTPLVSLRERIKDKILSIHNVKITYTDFLLKVCGMALRENLKVNSSFQNENYIIYDDVNVGLAVSVEEGLIVPTIYSCDKLSLLDIARKRVELADKANKGKLKLEEISNGTFTLTNLGMFGIRSFSAIINPPQAVILAVGEIYRIPAVIDGKIKVRSALELSLSCDHRIVDGVLGAKFLQRVVELIESPEILFI